MWCDHPFSQRKRTTERTLGVEVGGDREVGGGCGQNLKRGGRQYRGSSKNRGLAHLCHLCKETSKISHSPHYKTNPPIPGLPPFLVKISHPPPITAIFEKFYSLPLYEGGGGFGL